MRLLRKMVVLHRPARVPCTMDTHPALYMPFVLELHGAESRINSIPPLRLLLYAVVLLYKLFEFVWFIFTYKYHTMAFFILFLQLKTEHFLLFSI